MTRYLAELAGLFDDIEARLYGETIADLDSAIDAAATSLEDSKREGRKFILVGNGGSAAVASHIANDMVKNARLPAMVLTDPALLTCLANDYGYECVYNNPLALFGDRSDTLIAISSSGQSQNIINAAEEARDRRMFVMALTGFDADNSLRKLGHLSFHVPSNSYGMVEITHLAILHAIVDTVIARRI